nr:MAG TPA: helix-turn-helix domain protein [Caudoviricetes sp.]
MIIFDDKKYYTVKEVMETLKCSDRTVRRYVKAETLEGKQIARKLYVTEASIKEYLEGGVNSGKQCN